VIPATIGGHTAARGPAYSSLSETNPSVSRERSQEMREAIYEAIGASLRGSRSTSPYSACPRARVGQRNISTTADVYSHVLMDYREIDRAKLLGRVRTAHTRMHTSEAETASFAAPF
jgi:hypothetical protein